MDETTNPAGPEVEDVSVEEQEIEEAATETGEDGNPVEEPDEAEEDSEPEDDGLEDVEIDGKTYKVPKDAALRQADYTRKTQEVAEQRKEVIATLERLQSVSKEETQALSNVAFVAAQLSEYDNVDWDAWEMQNPLEAQRNWRRFTQLKEAYNEATAAYQKARESTQSLTQQETAKRLEEAGKLAAANIPGWNQDTAKATLEHSQKAYGLTEEDIMGAVAEVPAVLLLLHDAWKGQQANKQAVTVKRVEKQQAIKPAKTVKGANPVAPKGLDDRLSADEWLKRREAQLARR